MSVGRRPTTSDELIDALYVLRVSLGVVPGILKDVEKSLRDALVEERKMVDALMEGFKTVDGLPRPGTLRDLAPRPSGTSHFADASGRLRDVEGQLVAHLKVIRSGLTLLERRLGRRRGPGRPSELTGSELALAEYERAQGWSWAQVHKSVNAMRRELNQIHGGTGPVPTIPLTTLRTAVAPRHARKRRR